MLVRHIQECRRADHRAGAKLRQQAATVIIDALLHQSHVLQDALQSPSKEQAPATAGLDSHGLPSEDHFEALHLQPAAAHDAVIRAALLSALPHQQGRLADMQVCLLGLFCDDPLAKCRGNSSSAPPADSLSK